jgi:hypothetical protein
MKPLDGARVGAPIVGQQVEGHLPTKALVEGTPHRAHRASTGAGEQGVRADLHPTTLAKDGRVHLASRHLGIDIAHGVFVVRFRRQFKA